MTRTTFEKYTIVPRFTWVSATTQRKRTWTKKIEVSYGYPLSIRTREEACKLATKRAQEWLGQCKALGFPLESGEPLSEHAQSLCMLRLVCEKVGNRITASKSLGATSDTSMSRACAKAVSRNLAFVLNDVKGLMKEDL